MPRLGDLVELLSFLPDWLSMLIVILTITWTVCMAGIAAGKTGRNPLWPLLAFPFFPLLTLGLWVLALVRWPRLEEKKSPEA